MHLIHNLRMDLRRFDLNLLRVFDVVVSERSVSRAAAQLMLTQPAVSHALSRLRAACNDPILERRGRSMVPTPRAVALHPEVRALLARAQRVFSLSGEFDPAHSTRSFQIGCSDYAAQTLMPRALRAIRREAPDVKLFLVHAGRSDALDLLRAGTLDVALGVFNAADDALQVRTVLEEPYVCAMAKKHPLACGRLTLERYLQAEHVQVLVQPGISGVIEHTLARQGVERRIRLVTAHFSTALSMVTQSDLLLTAPRGLLRSPQAGGLRQVPVPFAVDPFRHQIALTKRSLVDPGITWLVTVIAHARMQR